MFSKLALCLCLILLTAATVTAQDADNKKKESDAKELSGMSIVGNDEAPKSLTSFPGKVPKSVWKPA